MNIARPSPNRQPPSNGLSSPPVIRLQKRPSKISTIPVRSRRPSTMMPSQPAIPGSPMSATHSS